MLNFILLALMPVAFALNPVVGKAMTGVMPPAQLTTVRWFLAGLLVALLAFASRKAETWQPKPGQWPRVLVLGAFGMGFCSYAAYAGAQGGSATNVSLIYTTTAALVVLYEILARQIKPHPLLITGVLLCMIGAATIITKGQLTQLASFTPSRGDLWAVAGTISWAAYTLAMKRDRSGLTPFAAVTIMALAGSAASVPFAIAETSSFGLPYINAKTVVWIAALVLIASVGSYLSYNLAIRRCGPILTSAALSLTSVYTAVLAMLLVSEELALFHAAGGALVIAGLLVINTQRTKPA